MLTCRLTHAHAHAHTYIHTHIRICTHTHTHTHARTYTGVILVSDAIGAMGLGEGSHTLGSMEIDVQNGSARVAGTRTLAGRSDNYVPMSTVRVHSFILYPSPLL